MLEAMAALMVLNLLCSVLMAWQLQAMQAEREALSTQQAVAMAQDLWQRMQVHPGAVPFYQLNFDSQPSASDCQTRACDAAQWAQADVADWWQELRRRMPEAKAQLVTLDHGVADVTLLLAWPSATTTASSAASANCPASHHCWETGWRL